MLAPDITHAKLFQPPAPGLGSSMNHLNLQTGKTSALLPAVLEAQPLSLLRPQQGLQPSIWVSHLKPPSSNPKDLFFSRAPFLILWELSTTEGSKKQDSSSLQIQKAISQSLSFLCTHCLKCRSFLGTSLQQFCCPGGAALGKCWPQMPPEHHKSDSRDSALRK